MTVTIQIISNYYKYYIIIVFLVSDIQVYEFFLFVGLMFIDTIIFSIMAKFYKYVEVPQDESNTEEIHMDTKNGTVNESYKDDEK